MAGSDLLRPDPATGLAIVIMGVSGCGKSTVAAMLADALGCGFVEADDYHSHANKGRGEDVAVSCSALRLKYREVLRQGDISYKPGSYETCRVKFVCLEASAEVIAGRVERRAAEGGHFMPASLVRSQLDLLEIDAAEGITVVDATVPAHAIVQATVAQFRDELASTAC
ncbi:unnamed protein product [Triticum turgidum subsp. durum]|uniref:gluconokinase n=1 Tax=Triticum turgidum subsp. durum TaxID=4567 RepID=A0A9R0Z2A2_TRITD|nr:unnamed protein product [Triticum turgidum subsp. durum]